MLKNFFGTLLLIGEHLHRQRVAVQGMEGLVERRLPVDPVAFDDSRTDEYNSVMAAALIDNRPPQDLPTFRTIVALAYGTPIEKMVGLDALRSFAASGPVLQDKDRDPYPPDWRELRGVVMQVYFRAATYTDELACHDELSREILKQAERLGVELAVPTKSNHATASAAEPHPVPPPPKLLGRERPETPPHGQSLATDHEPRSKRSS